MPDCHPDSATLCALFGGTFDPIHYGHLRPAEALASEVGLRNIILLPNHVPPHRPQPEASPDQRLTMVKLAIADHPLFSVDERELHRTTPSYTIDTLAEIRQERGPNTPLAFIIGQDSLLTLHLWHHWQHLLGYCHLLVCARPGYPDHLTTPELQTWFDTHQTGSPDALHQQACGLIYLAHTPLMDISATEIRQQRHNNVPCDHQLPNAVQCYIRQQGLYRWPHSPCYTASFSE